MRVSGDATRWREVLGFAPAAPTAAVALRIGLYAAVAVWALVVDVGDLTAVATRHWDPRSFLRLSPGPPSATVVEVARIALVGSALVAAVGAGGAVVRAAAAVTGLFVMGLHDAALGALSHNYTLPALLLLALAPAPLDAWVSVRAVRRRAAGSPDPPWRSVRWAWPVGLARALVVVVYASSGLAKLRASGLGWLDPDSFQRWTWVKLDRMGEPSLLGRLIVEQDAVAAVAAAGGLALQLSIVLALVWPAFRPVAAVGIVVFHVVTWWALDLSFLLTAAVAWLPLVDWERLRGRQVWWRDGRRREGRRRPRDAPQRDGVPVGPP